MSIITLVERQSSKSRPYRIYIDDRFAFAVHEDTMIRHRLFKGEEVDAERIALIVAEEERQTAMNDALRYLARRQHSVYEMRQKLAKRGYAASLIDEVIGILEQRTYMNDDEFALAWAEQRIGSHKKGRRWVKQELQSKGLSTNAIANALSRISPDDELQAASDLAAKKWKQLSKLGTDPERKRKTSAFLLRRGYSGSIVQQAIKLATARTGSETDPIEDDIVENEP